jgi:predicted outer membrane repeat protein
VALERVTVQKCSAGKRGGGGLLFEGEAEGHLFDCEMDDNSVESATGGHIHVAASSLILHSIGNRLVWPKQEPVFESLIIIEAKKGTSMQHGKASYSGGSVSCIASLSNEILEYYDTETEGSTCATNLYELRGDCVDDDACIEASSGADWGTPDLDELPYVCSDWKTSCFAEPAFKACCPLSCGACSEYICPAKGIFFGKGTTLHDSTSEEGGVVSASLCAIEMYDTSIINGTSAIGDGGAILVSSESTLYVGDKSKFENNTAEKGSGGAVSCQDCTSMKFTENTVFKYNVAGHSGGAVKVTESEESVNSTGSLFVGNIANELNGGAVESYSSTWNSKGDRFESNIALSGSGGAFAAFGSQISFDETTTCKKNSAPKGGGGCLLWEPEALNLDDEKWKTLEPVIGDVSLIDGNTALYGPTLATPGASLSVMNLLKMTTNGQNILNPQYPKVEVLDWYKSVVQGAMIQDVEITAKLVESEANLFGATVVKADNSGRGYFSALGVQGIPGSGPHDLTFESTLSLSDDTKRFLNTTTEFLQTWIKTCGENLYLDGDQCSKCPPLSASPEGSISINDCRCPDTHVRITTAGGTVTCVMCPLNSHLVSNDGPVTTACGCNTGYYSEISNAESLSCSKCPPLSASPKGSISINDCRCPDTHIRTNTTDGTVTCILCPAGQTKDKITGQCVHCKAGYFKETEGSSKCLPCGVDTWSAKIGATAPAECVSCAAERTTASKVGAYTNTSCLCKKDTYYAIAKTGACANCPKGANCSKANGMDIQSVSAQTGFWHSSVDGTIFSDCKKAYFGVDSERLAKERCCPIDTKTNNSVCMNLNLTATTLAVQCKKGYVGPMCKICAKKHVYVGGECVYCKGGRDLGTAIMVLCICCIPIIILAFLVLVCSKGDMDKLDEMEEKADSKFGQIKILLAFLQILSSMPAVMDGVPWPKGFLNLAMPFSAVNVDIMGIGTFATCNMSLLFPQQFLLHMCMPILFLISVCVSLLLVGCTHKVKNDNEKKAREAIVSKISIVGILFIYPGITTKVFTLFRCKEYPGIVGNLLEVDFTVTCGGAEHTSYTFVGIACLILYVIGIPFFMWFVLWRNKKSLWDTDHDHHGHTFYRYGGLYSQYEPQFWWFEVAIIMHKMLMTGALCVIGQGSTVQPLVAVLFELGYLLTVLKLAPVSCNLCLLLLVIYVVEFTLYNSSSRFMTRVYAF